MDNLKEKIMGATGYEPVKAISPHRLADAVMDALEQSTTLIEHYTELLAKTTEPDIRMIYEGKIGQLHQRRSTYRDEIHGIIAMLER